MRFELRTPAGGFVTVEVRRAGSRRNTRDQLKGVYHWSCTAFLGQHGDPFGTIEADSIDEAHDIVRGIVRARLQRKHVYERFYDESRP